MRHSHFLFIVSILPLCFSCGGKIADGGSATDVGSPRIAGIVTDQGVSGSVVDAAGQPLAGVIVVLLDTGYNALSQGPVTGAMADTTDSSGGFSLPKDSAGRWTVIATLPDADTAAAVVVRESDGDTIRFNAPMEACGCLDLLIPWDVDTSGLACALKGTPFAGTAGALYQGNWYWDYDGTWYRCFRLNCIPAGIASTLVFEDRKQGLGWILLDGVPLEGDQLQVLTGFSAGIPRVRAVYRMTLNP